MKVTKNTGLKLCSLDLLPRTTESRSCTAISASPTSTGNVWQLFAAGRALIYHEKTNMKPFEVQITQWVSPDPAFDTSDDELLYTRPTCSLHRFYMR
ncbi:MAG: hypothetical protein V8Q57_09700 [Blautia sp.]